VAVYALAVIVRLGFLLQARHNPLYQYPTIDERTHHEIAKAIATGTAPSTAYLRAPAYLYFLAGVYKVTGPDSLRARYVQVFVAGLAPVLVFLIGGRLFGPTVGLVAGLLSTVYWTFVFFSTELLDVSVASVLYLLLAYLLISMDDRRWWKWLVCGGMVGLGAITRPNILAYPAFLAVVVIWGTRQRLVAGAARVAGTAWLRIGLTKVGLLALGCALAIAPVTLRNLIVSGEPVLIAAWGPGALWASNNPHSDAKRMSRPPLDTSSSPILQDLRKDPWFIAAELAECLYIHAAQELGHRPRYSEVEKFYTRLSMAYVRQYPGKLLSDMFKRLCYSLNAYEYPFNKDLYHFLDYSSLLRALSWLHFGVICPVGILGLLLAASRRTWPAGLAYQIALILALVLPGALFPPTARYRLPAIYLLMPFVVYGIVELVGRLKRPIAWRRVAQPVGILAGLAVFCNINVFGLRPADTEHLLIQYLGASMATGRHDQAATASDEIVRALEDPNRAHKVPPNAMRPLFAYFHRQGDLPRAATYAWQMIRRRERADAETLGVAVEVLVDIGRRDHAAQALAVLESTVPAPNPHTALAMYRYGLAYGDRVALTKAAQQYAALSERHPNEGLYRKGLNAARRALVRLQAPPSSAPAASRPGR